MKKSCIFFAAIALASTGLAQNKVELKDEKAKVSYSIGLDIGSTFKKQKMDVDLDVLLAGLRDGMGDGKPLMTEEEVRETMTAYSASMREKQAEQQKEEATKNLAKAEKFLAENKSKEGVKTTASGLQYKVEKEGSGEAPKEDNLVVVHYRGTLIDGKEFDSSYKRNEAATFPVNRVIKGWTEALQLMKPGSKYKLFIPPNLAYGERGAGQDIGPNEALIFDVELIEVRPPNAPPTPVPGASPFPTPGTASAPAASPAAKPAATAAAAGPSPKAAAAKPTASPSPKK